MHVNGASNVPFADPPWYSGTPSPYYNDSHRRLAEFIRNYVSTELSPHAHEWEQAEEIPPQVYKRHADLGCLAAHLGPKSKMGAYLTQSGINLPANIPLEQWDPFHDFICADEFSRLGCVGVSWGLGGGNSIGFPPILNYGTESLKRKLLPGIINGSIRVCLGITEPNAGSDVAGIRTTANLSPDGKHYIVNGQKKWYALNPWSSFYRVRLIPFSCWRVVDRRITNGIWADYVTAAVRTRGLETGAAGISVLVIPLRGKGVKRRKLWNSGVHASGSTFIEFDDVEVPVSHLLGKENQGFQIIMSNFNAERLGLATQSLSLSRVCLHDSYVYSQTRKTFSKPLLSNQLIRHKIGLMSSQIASLHSHLESLIYISKTAPLDPSLPAAWSLAKVQAGQTLEFCVREAQQIFGGAGYQRGGGRGERIETISRDVRVLVVGGGSEEILIDLAVRMGMKTVEGKAKL